MWDCTCENCSRYHRSAMVRYLSLPAFRLQLHSTSSTTTTTTSLRFYLDQCLQQQQQQDPTPVDRIFCNICYSKLATRTTTVTDNNNNDTMYYYHLNMGCFTQEGLQWLLEQQQQGTIRTLSTASAPSSSSLAHVRPSQRTDSSNEVPPGTTTTTTLVDSCACGQCQYTITTTNSTEFQHCYCQLCRQLSGSPFMTWMPTSQWQWNNNHMLRQRIRTTPHGARDVCTQCGSVLTIVYPHQPSQLVWPSLHNSHPALKFYNRNNRISRVVHICTRYQDDPAWYQIPDDDGLERLPEAS